MSLITFYPCNLGDPNNVLNRGYHQFLTSEYGVACTLCGQPGPVQNVKLTQLEMSAVMDSIEINRDAMIDDGDEDFLPWLMALDSAEQKIIKALS